ncbi:putative dihydroxyacetone kinase regulator [Paenibacillus shirakamiensis]|uniref:Dihydroxyacetone kinase regulator n=1 Tax=Paenibacillus shirakamiensis TaxID=1265935 RepID=A0ABS4JIH5_9BACL|nr:dihydroxyacetone kinase transcriptional activator DhaS [Paenibacillus shirakamiensis]MBP2001510.1 putative dihydroxyacetone kinase regulator [Paenibacillus shirakamiensis]
MSNSVLTKKALASALKELMLKTPLNKITVKDLVHKCGVNRQTFYYHFQDLYALLGWIYQTEAIEHIAEDGTYEAWSDGFYKVFVYISNNKEFCVNTLHSLARDHLDEYLYSVTSRLIMQVLIEISGPEETEVDKHFIANFYTLAFTGLIIQWIRSGMKDDPQVMIEKLSDLMRGNFTKALHLPTSNLHASKPKDKIH